VSGPVFHRPGLSVTGKRTVDERRIVLAQRFVIEPQPLHDAGPELFDHDVVVGDQPLDYRGGPSVFKIQRDRPLPPAEGGGCGRDFCPRNKGRPERRQIRPGAGEDLQNIRTEIGKRHGRKRAWQQRRKIKNF